MSLLQARSRHDDDEGYHARCGVGRSCLSLTRRCRSVELRRVRNGWPQDRDGDHFHQRRLQMRRVHASVYQVSDNGAEVAITFSNLAFIVYGALTVEPDAIFTWIEHVVSRCSSCYCTAAQNRNYSLVVWFFAWRMIWYEYLRYSYLHVDRYALLQLWSASWGAVVVPAKDYVLLMSSCPLAMLMLRVQSVLSLSELLRSCDFCCEPTLRRRLMLSFLISLIIPTSTSSTPQVHTYTSS